jgi:hypothetical protein
VPVQVVLAASANGPKSSNVTSPAVPVTVAVSFGYTGCAVAIVDGLTVTVTGSAAQPELAVSLLPSPL